MSLKSQVSSLKFEIKDQELRIKFIVTLFFITLGIVSCAQIESKHNGIVIADSKSYEASLFRQNCAVCHGNEANGKEIDGKIIPSLRYGDATTKTEQEIYNQIKYGKLPMPAFGNQLTEEEIKKMVHFVRHNLQGNSDTEK